MGSICVGTGEATTDYTVVSAYADAHNLETKDCNLRSGAFAICVGLGEWSGPGDNPHATFLHAYANARNLEYEDRSEDPEDCC